MTARELLDDQIRRKFPDARVTAVLDDRGYALTVRSDRFWGARPCDAQAAVYEALARVPLTLLSRIHTIDCEPPDGRER